MAKRLGRVIRKGDLTPVERDAMLMQIKQKRCGGCDNRGERDVIFEVEVWGCKLGKPGFMSRGRICDKLTVDGNRVYLHDEAVL